METKKFLTLALLGMWVGCVCGFDGSLVNPKDTFTPYDFPQRFIDAAVSTAKAFTPFLSQESGLYIIILVLIILLVVVIVAFKRGLF